jgi:hypothetical protein
MTQRDQFSFRYTMCPHTLVLVSLGCRRARGLPGRVEPAGSRGRWNLSSRVFVDDQRATPWPLRQDWRYMRAPARKQEFLTRIKGGRLAGPQSSSVEVCGVRQCVESMPRSRPVRDRNGVDCTPRTPARRYSTCSCVPAMNSHDSISVTTTRWLSLSALLQVLPAPAATRSQNGTQSG